MSKEYTFNEWIRIHKKDIIDESEILNESTQKI